MKIEKNKTGGWTVTAEAGMALCLKEEQGPTETVSVCAPSSVDPIKTLKDCEYGQCIATETDKDTALARFGVEVDK